jgi:hypothetical protein
MVVAGDFTSMRDAPQCFLAVLTHNPTSVPDPAPSAGVSLLRQNEPNPFSGETLIRFTLARPEGVTITIFDASGRIVRFLAARAFDRGGHVVRWDGRNEAGSQVASGVYLYKLRTESFARQKKMVVIR